MAHVKITLDMRREKADGTYNIFYRITHFKRFYTINSGFSINAVCTLEESPPIKDPTHDFHNMV